MIAARSVVLDEDNPYLQLEDKLLSFIDSVDKDSSAWNRNGGSRQPGLRREGDGRETGDEHARHGSGVAAHLAAPRSGRLGRRWELWLLLLRTSLPFVGSCMLVFVPDVINVYLVSNYHVTDVEANMASADSSSRRKADTSAVGLAHLILNGVAVSITVGFNQGLDVYVPNSHLTPGKEYFALVYLARAHLLDAAVLAPVVLLFLLWLGPALLSALQLQGEHAHTAAQVALYLRGCAVGSCFFIFGHTAYRFCVFRGKVMWMLPGQLLTFGEGCKVKSSTE